MEAYRAGANGYNLPIAAFRGLPFALPTVDAAAVTAEIHTLDDTAHSLVEVVLRKNASGAYEPGLPQYAVRIAALLQTKKVAYVQTVVY